MPRPLTEAALELGVSVPTLRRWVRDGAPVARRGQRGRGHALLLDPEAVRAWRGAGGESLQVFAARIPELLADSIDEAFRLAEGVPARFKGPLLAGAWYLAATTLLDALAAQGVAVSEPVAPDKIARIRSILR